MSAAKPDPVMPLAAQRRALLDEIRPIEDAYATMHPDDPAETETHRKLWDLHAQLETIEQNMTAVTATSVAGLIEQMAVLKAHISVDSPEREALVDAVLKGLRDFAK